MKTFHEESFCAENILDNAMKLQGKGLLLGMHLLISEMK